MAIHETDREYGPTPPDADHEHTDIEPSLAWKFALWLLVGILISVAIVYGTFELFDVRETTASRAAQQFPLAEGQVKEPPQPRLQTQPFKDVYLLRQHETAQLESYGWVDKGAGVTRLPIERAMELTVERSTPARAGEGSAGLSQVVQDSSGGRTSAPRQ
jgi:hypothetical protein